MNRRKFLVSTALLAMSQSKDLIANQSDVRILFVHGRAQEGKSEEKIESQWLEALATGLGKSDLSLPSNIRVDAPFYGDLLEDLTTRFDLPLPEDIVSKGEDSVDEDFLRFQADVLNEIRQAAGITDLQIDQEYGDNTRPKGPQNWEWVQAIVRAIDKNAKGLTAATLNKFLNDTYLYMRKSFVRDSINQLVSERLTEQPTIIVAHSLGSVVAYDILRKTNLNVDVPLLITLGSPLGIRFIRDELMPIERSMHVQHWVNAYDERDVVALYPLDENNFRVDPPIENINDLKNKTKNRHGIDGYLDDQNISKLIFDEL